MAITRICTPKGSDIVGNTNFSEENIFVSKLFTGNHGTDPSLSFSIPKIFFRILIGAIIGNKKVFVHHSKIKVIQFHPVVNWKFHFMQHVVVIDIRLTNCSKTKYLNVFQM